MRSAKGPDLLPDLNIQSALGALKVEPSFEGLRSAASSLELCAPLPCNFHRLCFDVWMDLLPDPCPTARVA